MYGELLNWESFFTAKPTPGLQFTIAKINSSMAVQYLNLYSSLSRLICCISVELHVPNFAMKLVSAWSGIGLTYIFSKENDFVAHIFSIYILQWT